MEDGLGGLAAVACACLQHAAAKAEAGFNCKAKPAAIDFGKIRADCWPHAGCWLWYAVCGHLPDSQSRAWVRSLHPRALAVGCTAKAQHKRSRALLSMAWHLCKGMVVVPKWLRGWTRNPLCSACAGSNPADHVFFCWWALPALHLLLSGPHSVSVVTCCSHTQETHKLCQVFVDVPSALAQEDILQQAGKTVHMHSTGLLRVTVHSSPYVCSSYVHLAYMVQERCM